MKCLHNNQHNNIQYNDNEHISTWLHRTLYNGIQYSGTLYKNNLYNSAQHNEEKELPI